MIDFEKELAPESPYIETHTKVYGFTSNSNLVHRRRSNGIPNLYRAVCRYYLLLDDNYKKGTQYSDICKKCLKSYSMEEIKQLKHFLIVQKLKGK